MMQTKNKLFGASFEQSKKIIDESILTEDGARMGVFSSMSLWRRTTGLVGLLMMIVIYGVGVAMPDQFRQSTASVQVISQQSAALMGEIGLYLRPVIIVLMFTLIALTVLNIVPKGNYANQLLYGIFYLLVFQLVTFSALLPMAIGLTIDAFGITAFYIQIILVLYFVKKHVIDGTKKFKAYLFDVGEERVSDWDVRLMSFVKKYGGILLFLAILNRWTLKIGENVNGDPELVRILMGLLFPISMFAFTLMLGKWIEYLTRTIYFYKYRKEYREYFNITNEQWYGKFFARFMSNQK
jgi:putative membrane protein